MNNKLNNLTKRNKFVAYYLLFIFLLFFLIYFKFNQEIESRKEYILSQVLNIELNLLKEWQQNKGLKRNLGYNDYGYDVKLLQKMLALDSSIYPQKIITGKYKDLTVNAVRNFQEKYNLKPTGIVDEITRQKINEIFLKQLCPQGLKNYPNLLLFQIKNGFKLPIDYFPPNLVEISNNFKTAGIVCVSEEILPDLKDLINDSKKEGIDLMITSGYRSSEIQKYIFDLWFKIEGEKALDTTALPGFSEHQLGTALDFTDSSIDFKPVSQDFKNSKAGKWLQKNSYKYGFVLSYPENKKEMTGFSYEPWHYRFVGKEIAEYLYKNNIVLNELTDEDFKFLKIPILKQNELKNLNLDNVNNLSIFLVNEVDLNNFVLFEKNKNNKFSLINFDKYLLSFYFLNNFKEEDFFCFNENDCFKVKDLIKYIIFSNDQDLIKKIKNNINFNDLKQLLKNIDKEIELEMIDKEFYITPFDFFKILKYLYFNHKEILNVLNFDSFIIGDKNNKIIFKKENQNSKLNYSSKDFNLEIFDNFQSVDRDVFLVFENNCNQKIFVILLNLNLDLKSIIDEIIMFLNNNYKFYCD